LPGELGRSASTICRELRRNSSTRSNALAYRANNGTVAFAERPPDVPKLPGSPGTATCVRYVQERLSGQITRPNGDVVPGLLQLDRAAGMVRRQDRLGRPPGARSRSENRLRFDFPDLMRRCDLSLEGDLSALLCSGAVERWKNGGTLVRVPAHWACPTCPAQAPVASCYLLTTEDMSFPSGWPRELTDRAIPGHWEATSSWGLQEFLEAIVERSVERTTRFTLCCCTLPRIAGHGEQPRIQRTAPH